MRMFASVMTTRTISPPADGPIGYPRCQYRHSESIPRRTHGTPRPNYARGVFGRVGRVWIGGCHPRSSGQLCAILSSAWAPNPKLESGAQTEPGRYVLLRLQRAALADDRSRTTIYRLHFAANLRSVRGPARAAHR